MKEQTKVEKETNPEKYIDINDALKLEEDNKELFALGLLANNLQKNGTAPTLRDNHRPRKVY